MDAGAIESRSKSKEQACESSALQQKPVSYPNPRRSKLPKTSQNRKRNHDDNERPASNDKRSKHHKHSGDVFNIYHTSRSPTVQPSPNRVPLHRPQHSFRDRSPRMGYIPPPPHADLHLPPHAYPSNVPSFEHHATYIAPQGSHTYNSPHPGAEVASPQRLFADPHNGADVGFRAQSARSPGPSNSSSFHHHRHVLPSHTSAYPPAHPGTFTYSAPTIPYPYDHISSYPSAFLHPSHHSNIQPQGPSTAELSHSQDIPPTHYTAAPSSYQAAPSHHSYHDTNSNPFRGGGPLWYPAADRGYPQPTNIDTFPLEPDQGPSIYDPLSSILRTIMDPGQISSHVPMQPLQVDPPAATWAPHLNPTTSAPFQPTTVVPSHTVASLDPLVAPFTHRHSPAIVREAPTFSVEESNGGQPPRSSISEAVQQPQQANTLSFWLDDGYEHDEDDGGDDDAAFQRLSMVLAAGIEGVHAAPLVLGDHDNYARFEEGGFQEVDEAEREEE